MTDDRVQKNNFLVQDWGLLDYDLAYQRQKAIVETAQASYTDYLIFCEHPAVLTMGRLAAQRNILAPEAILDKKRVQTRMIDRGGDVTLHCPGQLVVYPILRLTAGQRDLRVYLEKLEKVAIDLLSDFDIVSNSVSGKTGVWVGPKKIVSIGIGVRRWVTFHGLALNVNNDLSLFELIRPCGMDLVMTSMREVLGTAVEMAAVRHKFSAHFQKVFGYGPG
ncbi:MAG: lipoyl(octanoyl) transferase LipB [Candidatus Omnitrophica bacterium]|nr:lipoyl(octanoyl) transferase LipB [Candidatus Omnitrophota bacterium]